MKRFTLPALGAGISALAMIGLTAGAASAHVTVTPDTTEAGGYAVLTFSVPHGCEGSPTTKVAIKMPEEIPTVTPTVNPNWSVQKKSEKLAKPITDAHGNELTERISQVVYTAKKPLADGYRDTLALSMQLPDQAGETLTFPTIQTCEKGQTAWTETAADGQDAEELEHPAPAITVSAASDADAEDGADGADGANGSSKTDGDAVDASSDEGTDGLAVGGLVAGVGGLALGGLALARTRKRG